MNDQEKAEQAEVNNRFLTKIGSPFRVGGKYRVSNGEEVTATHIISGIHPRIVFSDGWSRNARNGRVSSHGKNVNDVLVNTHA